MAKKKTPKKVIAKKTTARVAKPIVRTTPISKTMAVISLLLNIVIFPLPGVGSLIGGKTKAGIWQIVLVIVAIVLSATFSTTDYGLLFGVPILMVAWIWGIMTGVKLIQSSQ